MLVLRRIVPVAAVVVVVMTMVVVGSVMVMSVPVIMSGEVIHVPAGGRVQDVELGPHESLPGHPCGPNLETVEIESCHVPTDCLYLNPQVQERPHEHVAADAGKGVQIENPLHGVGSVLRTPTASLLIMSAWQAAPNPLSMFTTLTPVAQELSMARSAVTPPKLAP